MTDPIKETCSPCKQTGSMVVSDTPGGQKYVITCSTCGGLGFYYRSG